MSLTVAQCACSCELLSTFTLCSVSQSCAVLLGYINSYWGCGQVFTLSEHWNKIVTVGECPHFAIGVHRESKYFEIYGPEGKGGSKFVVTGLYSSSIGLCTASLRASKTSFLLATVSQAPSACSRNVRVSYLHEELTW